ncbi:MAG: hydrogenase nickel incorporation protein HypB [Candidatus Heimdallarchaeaceae archaeon]
MTIEKKVSVKKTAYVLNDELADKIRKQMNDKGKKFFNIMGSIGAGKTLLLERIAEKLSKYYKVFVINGDVATTIDADRIASHGAATVQINTGGGCHLNAKLIQRELEKINIDEYDIFFAENVGNLICPANWDVGAQLNVVVVSITEGEYVIKKHPIIFKNAEVAIINKCDLDGLGFDSKTLTEDAKKIKSGMKVICTSAKTGQGIDEFIDSLGIKLPKEA